jgi:hypothetical protein
MQDPSSDNAELSGLAAQLAALAPRASLDRDRLMFVAGQRLAARRLRIAHRWLAASGVACGSLLALLVTTRGGSNEPRAASTPPVAGPQSVVSNVPALPSSRLREKTSSQIAGDTLAMRGDGSANFRLLQLLGRDANADLAIPTDGDSAQSTEDAELLSPSTPRALLQQYLRDSHSRL